MVPLLIVLALVAALLPFVAAFRWDGFGFLFSAAGSWGLILSALWLGRTFMGDLERPAFDILLGLWVCAGVPISMIWTTLAACSSFLVGRMFEAARRRIIESSIEPKSPRVTRASGQAPR